MDLHVRLRRILLRRVGDCREGIRGCRAGSRVSIDLGIGVRCLIC